MNRLFAIKAQAECKYALIYIMCPNPKVLTSTVASRRMRCFLLCLEFKLFSNVNVYLI